MLQYLTTPVFGKDVVYDIPNEKFMEQKRFVKVGLTTDNFRAYVGMIEDEVDEFLAHDSAFTVFQSNDTSKWGSFNSTQALGEITVLTASRTLQGREVRQGLNKSFSQLYNDLDGGFTPLNFLFPNLPLPSYYRRDAAHQKMSDFYVDIIKNRRAGNSVSEFFSIFLSFSQFTANFFLTLAKRPRHDRSPHETIIPQWHPS
jgi:sterol 14-demethylase